MHNENLLYLSLHCLCQRRLSWRSHQVPSKLLQQLLHDHRRAFADWGSHVGRLVKAKVLQLDDVELRVQNLAAILAAAMRSKLMDSSFSVQDAEKSIRIGLEMLGISQAKLNKIFEIKLTI